LTDIHTWFGLTYSNYLVLDEARTGNLPASWQLDMTRMLDQLDRAFPGIKGDARYLALGGREWDFSDLSDAEMTRFGVTNNLDFIHDGCSCGDEPQQDEDETDNGFATRYREWEDARWDHERDELSWEYRGEEYQSGDYEVFPDETVEQAEKTHRIIVHRTLLQSMPTDWQMRFVALVDAAYDVDAETPDNYQVRIYRADGLEIDDPVPFYNRGRERLEPQLEALTG